jgi:RHS repeat-associated protein
MQPELVCSEGSATTGAMPWPKTATIEAPAARPGRRNSRRRMTRRKPASFAGGIKLQTAGLHSGCDWVGYDFAQGTTNHLYSVAALTDATGAVVERYSYSAYGAQTIKNAGGTILAKSAIGNDRSFTGYIKDDETGLCYARARMYAPTAGRFNARDIMGYIDGLALYGAYFIPNKTDPNGTEETTVTVNFKEEVMKGKFRTAMQDVPQEVKIVYRTSCDGGRARITVDQVGDDPGGVGFNASVYGAGGNNGKKIEWKESSTAVECPTGSTGTNLVTVVRVVALQNKTKSIGVPIVKLPVDIEISYTTDWVAVDFKDTALKKDCCCAAAQKP